MRAGTLWLASRTATAEREKDLVALIRVRFADRVAARRVERQLDDIADSVFERLRPLCEHEFGGLTDADKAAVLAEVGDTLQRADLSDDALFKADVDPVKLAREVRAAMPPLDKQLGEAGARLYDVVLAECCDCLVQIIVHLPQFGPRASAETLARLTGLADGIAAVLSRLPARTLYAPEGTDTDAEFTRMYLDHISRTLDTLELFGVRFERFHRPQTALSVAYISLNVSTDGARTRRPRLPHEVRLGDWREAATEAGGASRVESVLAKHRRLLIRGEAGSGKSTLLRWIAITAARGRFTGELAEWNGSVPFLIKLRSYAGRKLPTDEEFIDGVADPLVGIMPRAWVHRRLKDGRAVLLVDGVDELMDAGRQAVREWLARLLAAFPELRVVVTSRPAAASGDWLRAEGFGTSAVRTAWLINGPEALDVLSRYATDKRWIVHDELNDAWDYFDPDEYSRRVMAKISGTGRVVTVRTTGQLAAIRSLPRISGLHILNAHVRDVNFLTEYADELTHFGLYTHSPDVDFSVFRSLSKLAGLQLSLHGRADIAFLEGLSSLRVIWLVGCHDVVDYTPLARYVSLNVLGLNGGRHLTGIDMLPSLRDVTLLDLSGSRLDCGLSAVATGAPRLTSLWVRDCQWIDDLSSLMNLPLHFLDATSCMALEDVGPLCRLARLRDLHLGGTRVSDLTPLAGLKKLEHLSLDRCEGVSDLSPLASLGNLRLLHVEDVAPGIDLTPLADNKRLVVYIKPGQEVVGAEKFGRRLRATPLQVAE